jgi:hypothetical protein
MELFIPPIEPDLVRINIKQKGEIYHIATIGSTLSESYDIIVDIVLKMNLSPIVKGDATNIQLRESNAGVNGRTVSIRVYNAPAKVVYNEIIKKISR